MKLVAGTTKKRLDWRQVNAEETVGRVTDKMREGVPRMTWTMGLGSWVGGGAFL